MSAGTLVAANVQAAQLTRPRCHSYRRQTSASRAGSRRPWLFHPSPLTVRPGAWSGTFDLTNNKLVVEATAKPRHGRLQPAGPGPFRAPPVQQCAANYGHRCDRQRRPSPHPSPPSAGKGTDGNFHVLIAPEILGDANADGKVDLTDLSTVLNNFGSTTTAWTSGNFDGSATIDLTDLSDVLNNFAASNPNPSGQSTPVPCRAPSRHRLR